MWKDKYQKITSKIKKEHENEINILKRQTNKPYEEITAKKKISTLKNQLRVAKKENKDALTDIKKLFLIII